MPLAVLLSVRSGVPVVGCLCPSLMQAVQRGTISVAQWYSAAISASAAEPTTIFRMVAMTMIGALIICVLTQWLPRYM